MLYGPETPLEELIEKDAEWRWQCLVKLFTTGDRDMNRHRWHRWKHGGMMGGRFFPKKSDEFMQELERRIREAT
ncbi:MAG: hypothetical protein UY48_C0053G0006 [Candidatus Gottesmanbacteria bacterium GW2011_GWB1_49_7]|uniref:Uncharacterized protein n=1 Tax=Candidatus Gottesmanbacteria bacterium GW2011_GWB1_49_7 TaxID=1618448 RepID=A0A0G1YTV9_9BACT|nr:MAG: hypothetical protein UY48_C0053G0006 [Candidatus Gottesmanbacteria bacterium GW2011_GWB1_49_7]